MKVGYIRVSTVEQNTARQDDMLKAEKCDKIFKEKKSGKDMNRPELKKMLEYVKEGDTVVVCELSRLGRSMVDLASIAEQLRAKGVMLKSLKENIDFDNPSGVLMYNMLSAFAQFERDIIKERQKEGIRAALDRGQKWGAKQRYGTDDRAMCELFGRYERGEISGNDAIAEFGGSRQTFYNHYNKWRAENDKG